MRPVALAIVLATSFAAPTAFADDDKPASSGGSVDPSLRGPGSLSDASPQRRHPMLSFFVGFPAGYWGYGGIPFGVGARYLQPILHDGFVPSLNDSFSVEAGVDFYALGAARFGAALAIPIEAMWALYFSTKFSGYLKVGAALEIRFAGDWCWGNGPCGGLLAAGLIAQLGIMYRITDAITLRAELGYPGLKVGIGLPL
jgi:hypothetical protein